MKRTARQLTEVTIADFYRAMDRQHPVTITYIKADGTETIRTVEPYEIRTTGKGDVIVKAMDRQSGESRTFRIDRIVSYSRHRTAFVVARPADAVAPRVPVTTEEITLLELSRDDRTYWTTHFDPAA